MAAADASRVTTALVAAVLVLTALVTAPRADAIIAGEAVANDSAPWLAALVQSEGQNEPLCTGVRVHHRWALTAGHCPSATPDVANLFVGRESANVEDPTSSYWVSGLTVPHPDWSGSPENDNDCCAGDPDLRLVPVADNWLGSIAPDLPVMRLPTTADIALMTEGRMATVMGYGATTEDGPTEFRARVAQMPIRESNDVCNALPRGGNVQSSGGNEFCAGDLPPSGEDPGADVCPGDSGGPLFVEHPDGGPVLLGIASFGQAPCGTSTGGRTASGFAHVINNLDWIESVVDPIADVPDIEVSEGAGSVEVGVELTRPVPPDTDVEQFLATYEVTVVAGSATAGEDFTPVATTQVTIPAGARTGRVTVPLLDDATIEEDETLLVSAVSIAVPQTTREIEAFVRDGAGVVTILDDDQPEPQPDPQPDPETGLTRLAADDRIGTAIAVSQGTFASAGSDEAERVPAGAVVVASGYSFPDALVGTPLAAQLDAPLLLTKKGELDGRVLDETRRVLSPGGTVIVLGGTGVIDRVVEDELRSAGFDVRRIAGTNRYETAVLVADELDGVASAFLATGQNFPDALSAGAAAAAGNGAVLLTNDAALPDTIAAWLSSNPVPRTAVGGQAAAAVPDATPIVGGNRYETAVLVARTFFPEADVVGVASGANFPDALSGGADIARAGGPLLLTSPTSLPQGVADHLQTTSPLAARVYGGAGAVTDAVRAAVEALLG